MHGKGFGRAEPWQVLVLVPRMCLMPWAVLLLWLSPPAATGSGSGTVPAREPLGCFPGTNAQYHCPVHDGEPAQLQRHTAGKHPRFCSGSADAPSANSTFCNICWNQCPLPNQKAFCKHTHWDKSIFILQEYGGSQRLEANEPLFPLSYPPLEGPWMHHLLQFSNTELASPSAQEQSPLLGLEKEAWTQIPSPTAWSPWIPSPGHGTLKQRSWRTSWSTTPHTDQAPAALTYDKPHSGGPGSGSRAAAPLPPSSKGHWWQGQHCGPTTRVGFASGSCGDSHRLWPQQLVLDTDESPVCKLREAPQPAALNI